MGAELTPFGNGEFELQMEPHDEDGFRVFAPGLARALSISDAYTLLRSIPDEEKGSALVRTPGGEQRVGYVTEAGFYRALASRQLGRIADDDIRSSVERFQAWVYREVLPALRRGQSTAPAPRTELSRRDLAEMVIAEADRADHEAAARQVAESKVAELEPAAQSWNHLAAATGDDFSVADAAQILSRDPDIRVGRDRLFSVLRDAHWIYRGHSDQRYRCYQQAVEAGRLSQIPMSHYHPRTGELVLDPPQIRVTVKGLEWLHRHLGGTAAVAVPARQEALL